MDFPSSNYCESLISQKIIYDGYTMNKEKVLLNSLVTLNFSKSFLYMSEYKMLYHLNRMMEPFVKAPKKEDDPALLKLMREKVLDLYLQDANNVLKGYYPKDLLLKFDPKNHLLRLPKLFIDSLSISRRRKIGKTKDLDSNIEAPDYIKRNFHFQTDGYFSEHSASLYEHQVEILFNGTAQAMRRMLIGHLKKRFPEKKFFKILEVAAGTGAMSGDFAKSFDFNELIVTDISEQYLNLAKEKINDSRVSFSVARAEELPFKDGEFDLVYSVFLFHEIPRQVRDEVLRESHRVLKSGGVFALCDSIQKDDDSRLNEVLDNFPRDYHEPFYRDYTKWNASEALINAQFSNISSEFHLLSKYFSAVKN